MKFTAALLLVAGIQSTLADITLPPPVGTISTPATPAAPSPPNPATAPQVNLGYGVFQGKVASGINNFLGIPFARPPVGDLRFRRAVLPLNYTGIQDATKYGASCTQQSLVSGTPSGAANGSIAALVDQVESMPPFTAAASDSEDCLTVNVIAPATLAKGQTLPVVVYIYGGGFEVGSTSGADGTPIVTRSIATNSPIIYVSMNYRLNAFGFLAGAEVQAAGVGNLGLDDQRAALRWVQSYIHLFGGDPAKVTLMGESAGAISIGLQMVSAGGHTEGLYRGAFCLSGSPFQVGSILHGQPQFDFIAKSVGCTGVNKTLACLRKIPYQTLKAAMDQTPGIFSQSANHLAWTPRVDGVFLTQAPFDSVAAGAYAKVPLVTGDCDDEGTLFSVTSAPSITTDAQAVGYIQSNYLYNATAAEIADVALLYPDDPVQGSPFGTGYLNQLTPQFKRIAAFTGDYIFHAPRRHFLNHASKTQATWSHSFNRVKNTPFLGSFHSSDITTSFFTGPKGGIDNVFIDYLVNFVTKGDPNDSNNLGLLPWPKWDNTNGSPASMAFVDRPKGVGTLGLEVISDTFRKANIDYLIQLSLKYPI